MSLYGKYMEIVDRYSEPLYWYIRRMVVSHEDAQDILQDTLLAAYRKLWQVRDEEKLKSWIYRIATNRINRHFRTKARECDAQELPDIGAITYADCTDKAEIKLQKAIKTLTPFQQTVFNLRYYDELGYDEMSAVTGSSVGSLKVVYHNAKEKIIKYIEDEQL